jgi:aminocarboxymuconate-semialdehyde decarboxylase
VLHFVIAMLGSERLMMGSDSPFPIGDLEPTKIVEAAGLSADQVAAVNGGLAQKVFGIR